MLVLNKFLAFLAYTRRVFLQLKHPENLKYVYLIFRGFTPNKGYFYDFKSHGYDRYVTDKTRYLENTFINFKYQNLFKDKYSNYLFLRQYTGNVVPIYALVDKGMCFFVDKYPNLETMLREEKKFVLKPRTGWGGKGVVVLEVLENEAFLNGNPTNLSTIFSEFDNYVLVPFIEQHEYSRNINPGALNTIRFLTGVLDDEVQIIGAIHRFGSSLTGCVDNFSQGGISAKMDPYSGVIDAVYSFNAKTKRKYKTDTHPNTKEQILGVEIPHWPVVKREVIQLHDAIKFVKYIGWDIAITSDGYKIIESNHVSDVDGFQIHGPLMNNEINRRFYQSV